MTKRNIKNKIISELVVNDNPKSPVSEKVRTLRTNIQFSSIDKEIKTILVTSASPGDGKSWISANLAIAFAQTGDRVLLIDSDLRKGRQHKIFKLKNTFGFSNFLFEYNKTSEVKEDGEQIKSINMFHDTIIKNLIVMTSGAIPPNPTELLESKSMLKFLEEIKNNFDIIIFDGPPVNVVADALILTRLVDTTVLVSAYKATQMKHLIDAKKAIQNVGGKIAGVVLNKMEILPGSKEYSNYYSYYNN